MHNRPGAGGLIGAELAARATPDGYTLLLSSPGPLTILPHIKAGRMRLPGVASARRSPQLPDVPTIAEAGVPGYEAVSWFARSRKDAAPRHCPSQ